MFEGKDGRTPEEEAKRYIYAVLASSLMEDLNDLGGWVFGGMDNKADRALAREAAKVVLKSLRRNSKR
jgi:hypothetical protein